MTSESRTLTFSFKLLLLLLALLFGAAIVALILSVTSAATATGRAPSLAITLVEGTNSGILGPGEQRWFRWQPGTGSAQGQTEAALTLFFSPGDGNQTRAVSLKLYEADQVTLFYEGDSSRMVNLGAGQPLSRDGDPQTGELVWTGWLLDEQSYYVQMSNSSQMAVDYWLVTADVVAIPQPATASTKEDGGMEARQVTPGAETGAMTAAVPAPVGGDSPETALPLRYRSTEGTPLTGDLAPGQEVWYSLTAEDGDQEFFEAVALTMFATPNERQQAERLNFELFTAEAVRGWQPGQTEIDNFGAGSRVQRDNDPRTTEHFWTGWLLEGNMYYLRIRSGAEVPVDYWLFSGDVYQPELGGEVIP